MDRSDQRRLELYSGRNSSKPFAERAAATVRSDLVLTRIAYQERFELCILMLAKRLNFFYAGKLPPFQSHLACPKFVKIFNGELHEK